MHVNYDHPVNWSHPLNQGRVVWYLNLPGWAGSRTQVDLCQRFPAVANGGWTGGVGSPLGGLGIGFDGSNDNLTVGNRAGLSVTGDLTIAAWIYPTASPSGTHFGIFTKGPIGTEITYSLVLINVSRAPRLARWNSGLGLAEVTSATSIALNTWTRVGVTVVGTTATFYLNGKAGTTGTTRNPAAANTASLEVGGSSNGNNFWYTGSLDDVSLWNRGLSASEMNDDYRLGLARYRTSPSPLNFVRPSALGSVSGVGLSRARLVNAGATGSLSRAAIVNAGGG